MDYVSDGETKIIGINQESPYIIQKRKEAIERLGTKWLLHPENFKQRNASLGKIDTRVTEQSTVE